MTAPLERATRALRAPGVVIRRRCESRSSWVMKARVPNACACVRAHFWLGSKAHCYGGQSLETRPEPHWVKVCPIAAGARPACSLSFVGDESPRQRVLPRVRLLFRAFVGGTRCASLLPVLDADSHRMAEQVVIRAAQGRGPSTCFWQGRHSAPVRAWERAQAPRTLRVSFGSRHRDWRSATRANDSETDHHVHAPPNVSRERHNPTMRSTQ